MAQEKRRYNRIKAMLALKDKSSKELATHMGINAQTVSKWCTNSRQPRLDELFAVAEFLGVSTCELIET